MGMVILWVNFVISNVTYVQGCPLVVKSQIFENKNSYMCLSVCETVSRSKLIVFCWWLWAGLRVNGFGK